MISITVNKTLLQVEANTLISDILPSHHTIAMPCAGKGICGKCKVIATGALSPLTAEEQKHLTLAELQKNIRLACCAKIQGSVEIQTQAEESAQIRTDGFMPTFEQKPLFKNYGIAIDIGTTTLAANLYSLQGLLAWDAMPNPQSSFGADVISRIEKSLNGQASALAQCIQTALSTMITTLCASANIQVHLVDTLVITGNTAMLYLLTQTNPVSLSKAPFEADRLFGETVSAQSLQLPCKNATIYLPRCISAFVGADITTALLASTICEKTSTALLADIGTNGELALWHNGKLTCCSTAAGPAFEGAGLSMGMAGKNGAIDHVQVQDNHLVAHTIGETQAKGICGSGIIDALACLLKTQELDETGILEPSPYVIKDAISINQQDVRAVQLAKSAICAGIQTLLQTKNVKEENLQQLGIAGGFGSYVNIQNAAAIGLIPQSLAHKTAVLGNAALVGATMLLLNSNYVQQTIALAQSATTVELSTSATFMDLYVENMMFETE